MIGLLNYLDKPVIREEIDFKMGLFRGRTMAVEDPGRCSLCKNETSKDAD